jgi:predicted RNase H-like HicB family nuclease
MSKLEDDMSAEMTMIYWKSEKFWLGKLKEHPEIMTQGRTLKELEENLKDAYRMMVYMATEMTQNCSRRRETADLSLTHVGGYKCGATFDAMYKSVS